MSGASAPLFTAGEVASITGATLLGETGASVESVVVDSRKAGRQALFVALPGERNDGHAFVGAAIKAGASCVLARADRRAAIEGEAFRLVVEKGAAIAFVPDALAALSLIHI